MPTYTCILLYQPRGKRPITFLMCLFLFMLVPVHTYHIRLRLYLSTLCVYSLFTDTTLPLANLLDWLSSTLGPTYPLGPTHVDPEAKTFAGLKSTDLSCIHRHVIILDRVCVDPWYQWLWNIQHFPPYSLSLYAITIYILHLNMVL